MKKLAVLLLFAALPITGCYHLQNGWKYSTNNYEDTSIELNKTVVVSEFEDARDHVNNNFASFCFIPLMPFGWVNTDGPASEFKETKSVIAYPKALVEEINKSKLFKEAHFGKELGGNDYIVQGKILTTRFKAKQLSYGVSVCCTLLYIVGLPVSTVENNLSIELSLIDAKSKGLLFSNRYTAPEYSKIGWLYYMPSQFNYPEMLKGIYKQFIDDLKNRIS